jgi:GGDEF domain-containing protein
LSLVVVKREYRPGRRRQSILVRYAEDEFAVVSAAAARVGLAATSYVAEAALATACETEPPSASPLRELAVELMQARLEVRRVGVNVDQAVTVLNKTGAAPPSLMACARQCDDAVARLDGVAARVGRALR